MDIIKGLKAIREALARHGVDDEVMAKSINTKYKGGVDDSVIAEAVQRRKKLMAEPAPGGTPVQDMTQDQLEEFGRRYGVDLRLTPTETVVDPKTGRSWEIPGGLDRGKPFTLTDAHYLKSQGYDPNEMPADVRVAIQNKFTDAATPYASDQYADINRMMFGAMSPNTGLLNNEMQLARMRVRSPEDLARLEQSVPWAAGENVAKALRTATDRQIGQDYGLSGAYGGGLGMRSSADLTNMAEIASYRQQYPGFFDKPADMPWREHAERIISQIRGLSPKTASFGSVWQAPGEATISAMDRHMARNYRPDLLAGPQGDAVRASRVPLWNKNLVEAEALRAKGKLSQEQTNKLAGMPGPGARPVESYDEIVGQPNWDSWDLDRVIADSTKHRGLTYRTAKGDINPKIPPHLVGLPLEPEKVTIFGDNYLQMLARNEQTAKEHGLNTFGEQWRVWDGIRERLEPHEVMHRDAHKLPPLSAGELYRSFDVQKKAGYGGSGKVDPYNWRDGLYWGAAGPAVGAGLMGASGDSQASDWITKKMISPEYAATGGSPRGVARSGDYRTPLVGPLLGEAGDRLARMETPGGLLDMPYTSRMLQWMGGDASRRPSSLWDLMGHMGGSALELADPASWGLMAAALSRGR